MRGDCMTSNNRVKSWRWLVIVLALCAMVSVRAHAQRQTAPHFFDLTLGDFKEELQTAREMGKAGVVLFFEMKGCPFCHHMKEKVFSRPEVHDYYKKHFLIFSVDTEGSVEITDFLGRKVKQKEFAQQQYKVQAVPAMIFIDLDSKPVARFSGVTSDIDEVLRLGEYVVAGIYKQMPFSRYKHVWNEM